MFGPILNIIRPYSPTLVGSAVYSPTPNDIDILIAVPLDQIQSLAMSLLSLGYQRNTPDPVTTDRLVHSAYSHGKIDIQICTPENYIKKRAANRIINRLRLHTSCTKCQRYQIYEALYKLMQ